DRATKCLGVAEEPLRERAHQLEARECPAVAARALDEERLRGAHALDRRGSLERERVERRIRALDPREGDRMIAGVTAREVDEITRTASVDRAAEDRLERERDRCAMRIAAVERGAQRARVVERGAEVVGHAEA